MKQLLIMTLAVVLGVSIVGLAQAEVQNIKVSGDLTTTWFDRANMDGTKGTDSNFDGNGIMTQTRVRLDADLTENVGATVVLINERDWDTENDGDAEIDIDQAYFELNEFFYPELDLSIGRQPLKYGNGLVVGDPDTNQGIGGTEEYITAEDLSLRKSFDLIKASLDFSPLIIDLIYAKVDSQDANNGESTGNQDIDLYGIAANYTFDNDYNVNVAPYILYANRHSGTTIGLTPGPAQDNRDEIIVYGIGATGDVNDQLSLMGELAFQSGDDVAGTVDREGWAFQLGGMFQFESDMDPMLGLSYVFLSGEESGNDVDAWDPLFEDQVPGVILNAIAGNTNMQYFKLEGSLKPREDVTLLGNWTYAWLDETLDGSAGRGNNPFSGVTNLAEANLKADEDDIGHELDVVALYDYTEDVQMSLTVGAFWPGDLFPSSYDETATTVQGAVKVSF